MKSVIGFFMGFLNNKKVIEIIFCWLRKLAMKTETSFDNKAIDISEYLITDPEAHKVIDEIVELIKREKSK